MLNPETREYFSNLDKSWSMRLKIVDIGVGHCGPEF